MELAQELLGILEQSENDLNEEYPFIEEDLEEKKLKEKYKDAIKWRGPFFHGHITKMDGYEIRTYSNDHGSHFHVIHNGKRINARFSFPEIELINYKNTKNSIDKKTIDRIATFLLKPENFKKLEEDFKKRG